MNKNFTPHSKTPLEAVRDRFTKERKGSCLCENTRNIGFWKVILLAFFTLSFIGCEKIFPKTTPTIPTIPMPTLEQLSATKDTKVTRTAILTGVQDLGWEIKGEAEGQIDVVRQDQTRMAAIRITYDEQIVNFHYLRSSNFDCELSGVSCSKIHRVYGEWVDRLRSWVKHELELAKIPPELIGEPMKRYEAISTRIGNSEPGSNYEQIGPISGEDGRGCGVFGRPGTYDEAAVEHLKQVASRLGATYVQIIQLTDPHQSSINCFDNRYQIRGFAFREARTSHDVEKKLFHKVLVSLSHPMAWY